MKTTTIAGRKLTTSAVLAAVAECDRLGVVAFLDRYGYGRARTWHLRANGRSYPSKAIIGVAIGLKASEFFGGAHGAVRALLALGFEVRNAEGQRESVKLDLLRRLAERQGLDVRETPWPRTTVQPTAYFASGSNQPAQIRALGACGADVGVAVPNLSYNAEQELLALAGTDVCVFVDSGAFSEVKFGPEGRTVVKPIDDAAWDKVLCTYERLAVLGNQLFVVAPDCVGDQEVSINRIARYADRVRALIARGVRVLVPIQKGATSQVDYALAINTFLGLDWIPALPCKKAATSADELADFVRGFKPTHVHLLGLGIRNRNLRDYLIAFEDTDCGVSLDSCWITANTGTAGKGRRLTRALSACKQLLARVGVGASPVTVSLYCCLSGGLAS